MPKPLKPQLNHWGFDWDADYKALWLELKRQWPNVVAILDAPKWEKSTFEDDPTADDEAGDDREAAHAFRELAEVLATAVATRIDFGFKPARPLIATLTAVRDKPERLWEQQVESEALVEIERHFDSQPGQGHPFLIIYQRAKERNFQRPPEPGEASAVERRNRPADKSPFDAKREAIFKKAREARAASRREPVNASGTAWFSDSVRDACDRAIRSLEGEAKRGRPKDVAIKNLAVELAAWLTKHGHKPTLINRNQPGAEGQHEHFASGELLDLVEALLEPANTALRYAGAKSFKSATLAKQLATQLRGK